MVVKAIRMEPQLIEDIKSQAVKENRNFSNMVTTIIMRELDSRKAQKMSS